jgi:hypothetical protein
MSDYARTARLLGGSALLTVGALFPRAERMGDVMLVFGAVLLTNALSPGTARSAGGLDSPVPIRRRPTGAARVRSVQSARLVGVAGIVIVGVAAGVHPFLARGGSSVAQATLESGNATVSGGHAIGASPDAQLHHVSLGVPFRFLGGRVAISSAQLCRHSGVTVAAIPVTLASVGGFGSVLVSPAFRLVDASGIPHDPERVLTPGRLRGSAAHAAPPPAVFREIVEFTLTRREASGTLRLEAQRPDGAGAIFRAAVASGRSSASPPAGGSASCTPPGGAA